MSTVLLEQAAQLMLTLSAPVLGAAALAGLFGGLGLALARLDDPLLRALPRLVAGWLALLACAAFAGGELGRFAQRAYTSLAELTR